MSLTVGQLKQDLRLFKDDAVITNHEGGDFVHLSSTNNGGLIMSTEKPIGYCKRSGGYVFLTEVEDYLGVSTEIDENVDLGEIDLPNLDLEEFPSKFIEPIEKVSKYKEPLELLINELGDSIPQEVWEKLYKFDIENLMR
jgi:hypothetical protein